MALNKPSHAVTEERQAGKTYEEIKSSVAAAYQKAKEKEKTSNIHSGLPVGLAPSSLPPMPSASNSTGKHTTDERRAGKTYEEIKSAVTAAYQKAKEKAAVPPTLAPSSSSLPPMPSAVYQPSVKEGRQTRTSLKTPSNTLNLLPEPTLSERSSKRVGPSAGLSPLKGTRKHKPKSPNLPIDSLGLSIRNVRLNEEGAVNKQYQANLPNLDMKANTISAYPRNTAVSINELLRNTSGPNLNLATSTSNYKPKQMKKENMNKHFKINIQNLSLRKQSDTRRIMNKYLRTNVGKPNPPLGRLIEGHLKEPKPARNLPAYVNTLKRNRQNNKNAGPSSKRPHLNNNKTGGRRKTRRHSRKY